MGYPITGKQVALISLLVSLSAIVSGCSVGTEPLTEHPVPTTGSFASTLQDLERSGDLPQLDRGDSVLGVDSDANGIRDDLDSYIDSLSDSTHQKAALARVAAAFNTALATGVTEIDPIALREVANGLAESIECAWDAYGVVLVQDRLNATRSITANTAARMNAYAAFNAKLDGWVARLPTTQVCDDSTVLWESYSEPPSLCENRGYVVCFFNGVWNDYPEALIGLRHLRLLVGDVYLGEPLRYELMYNHTGSLAGATGLQDLAETFMQRASEIDPSGNFGGRMEYLWEVLAGGERPFWDRLLESFPAAIDVINGLFADLRAESVGIFSSFLSNPPTDADYSAHRTRLDELALQGQKLLLVAHSQGNLFVDKAYGYISQQIGSESVAVVHIAPATEELYGEYVLADIDLVINPLRLILGSTPEPNLELGLSSRDPFGHELVGTYLDPNREGRRRVGESVERALSGLVTPSAAASIGFFTVTLTWDGTGDVDLHTIEPDGSHVYYSKREGNSGYLDVDNTQAIGPEHYFATCSASELQTGIYQIGVNNYSNADGRLGTVQVASNIDGVIAEWKDMDVGPERGSSGNSSPMIVITVEVFRDERGSYSIRPQ